MIRKRKSYNLVKFVFILFCLIFLFSPNPVFSQFNVDERIERIQDKFQTLPVVRTQEADSQEEPTFVYSADDLRDPFHPQIFIQREKKQEEPKKVVHLDKVKVSETFSLIVQGVIWDSDIPLAIINNKVLKEGEFIPVPSFSEAVTILDIDKEGVTILYSGEAEKLFAPSKLESEKTKGEQR